MIVSTTPARNREGTFFRSEWDMTVVSRQKLETSIAHTELFKLKGNHSTSHHKQGGFLKAQREDATLWSVLKNLPGIKAEETM